MSEEGFKSISMKKIEYLLIINGLPVVDNYKKCHDGFMNHIDNLKVLINSFFNMHEPKKREMKRIFQWRRYLDWKDLTPEEKLTAKRLLLVPLCAYLIMGIFNQNFSLIVLFLIGYVLYRKFEKGGIVKKNK